MICGLLCLILEANPDLFRYCAALSEAADAPDFEVIYENLVWCNICQSTLKQVSIVLCGLFDTYSMFGYCKGMRNKVF